MYLSPYALRFSESLRIACDIARELLPHYMRDDNSAILRLALFIKQDHDLSWNILVNNEEEYERHKRATRDAIG
jgi:hypothetical protein